MCYSAKEKTGFFIFFFSFWFRAFNYWVVRELFLTNYYKMIFGLWIIIDDYYKMTLALCQWTFNIKHSLIHLFH